MKLYVEHGKKETIEEFLKAFYSNTTHDRANAVATYFDEECLSQHCYQNRLRSFDDIFDCVQTYFPEATVEEVFKTLVLLDIKDTYQRDLFIHLNTCSSIQRQRILYYYNIKDCFTGLNTNQYQSKYSWKELFEKIGVEPTVEAINKFILDRKTKIIT